MSDEKDVPNPSQKPVPRKTDPVKAAGPAKPDPSEKEPEVFEAKRPEIVEGVQARRVRDDDDSEDPGALTEAEKEKIRAEVRAKLSAERKKSAMQHFREQEEYRMRLEEGLTVGGVMDDTVTITLDLAKHSPNIIINHKPYWHGQQYTVPRHVAATLAEIQFRGWQHQYEIDGKTRFDFYQSMRETVISRTKGVKNAPKPAALPGQG